MAPTTVNVAECELWLGNHTEISMDTSYGITAFKKLHLVTVQDSAFMTPIFMTSPPIRRDFHLDLENHLEIEPKVDFYLLCS